MLARPRLRCGPSLPLTARARVSGAHAAGSPVPSRTTLTLARTPSFSVLRQPRTRAHSAQPPATASPPATCSSTANFNPSANGELASSDLSVPAPVTFLPRLTQLPGQQPHPTARSKTSSPPVSSRHYLRKGPRRSLLVTRSPSHGSTTITPTAT